MCTELNCIGPICGKFSSPPMFALQSRGMHTAARERGLSFRIFSYKKHFLADAIVNVPERVRRRGKWKSVSANSVRILLPKHSRPSPPLPPSFPLPPFPSIDEGGEEGDWRGYARPCSAAIHIPAPQDLEKLYCTESICH